MAAATASTAWRSSSTTQERATEQHLPFFGLEINQLMKADYPPCAPIPESPIIARGLDNLRLFRDHQLSDEQERLLHEKPSPGRPPGSVCSMKPWPACVFRLMAKP